MAFSQDSAGVIRDDSGNIIGADPSAATSPGATSTSTAAVTTPSSTDALLAGLTNGLANALKDPKTQGAIATGVGGAFTAVENLFGIQTPQQQAAQAQQAAAAAQQQQQTMLIVGGVVLGVILIGVTWYVMRSK